MPALEPWVPGQIYGTGESQNYYDGVPQPANFLGMSPWWTVPTNWYIRWTDGQPFVSPTWDFTAWVFAAKIDQDGYMKFQFPYGIRQNGMPGIPMDQFVVTYPPQTFPPQTVYAQIIFFSGLTPQVFPAQQSWPAIAYNDQSSLYGWDTSLLLWFPIIAPDSNTVTPDPDSPVDAGSGQILFFPGSPTLPGQFDVPAIGYDSNNRVFGWLSSINKWLPIISDDSSSVDPVGPYNPIAGQLVYGAGANPPLPSNQNAPQLYFSALATLYGWDYNNKQQIPLILGI